MMSERAIMSFNSLPIGCVFEFGSITGVKIRHADTCVKLDHQKPNTVNLDNRHYIVVSAEASCSVIKVPDSY